MSQMCLSVGDEDLFVFETVMPVMLCHVSYGNHLSNDSILTLLQEARMQYLMQEGATEISLQESVGFLVNQATINYRAQAYYGDKLRVQIYAPRFKLRARKFDFNYQILRVSDGAVIADASTSQVFYDFLKKRITTAPKSFYWMIHRNLQLITRAA